MAWEQFKVDEYKVYSVTGNTSGFAGIYGFIYLYWQDKRRATLWFYRDSVATIPDNASFTSGGSLNYYGRFSQAQLGDCVDLLRNEAPVYFHWNDKTKGVFLSSGEEPVGEGEGP